MSPEIAKVFTYLLAMIGCLSVHEASHALMAKILGDSTAEREGRLTLNPLAHIDPVGTILLPVLGALSGFPVIGWARPVPFNGRNLRLQRIGPALVAAAGPVANLVFCALCLYFYSLYRLHGARLLPPGSLFYPFIELLEVMVAMNAMLAFFNLLPLPPLDGAKVLGLFLSQRQLDAYEEKVTPFSYLILMGLIIVHGLWWVSWLARLYISGTNALIVHFLF